MDLMTETEVRDVAGGGVESLMDADGRWRVPRHGSGTSLVTFNR